MGFLSSIRCASKPVADSTSDDWHLGEPPSLAEPPSLVASPDAGPCSACGFVGFWVDYEGERRCCRCVFPPTLAVVAAFVGAVKLSEGVFGWQDFSDAMRGPFSEHFAAERRARVTASSAAQPADKTF